MILWISPIECLATWKLSGIGEFTLAELPFTLIFSSSLITSASVGSILFRPAVSCDLGNTHHWEEVKARIALKRKLG